MTKQQSYVTAVIAAILLSAAGCTAPQEKVLTAEPGVGPPPYPSTYEPPPAGPILISGATVLTGRGEQLDDTDVLLSEGKVAAIGKGLEAPAGATHIDAKGKWLTPGLIDVHSHLGVYPSPAHEANQDGNEITNPNTAQVWAEHSVWTQDPQFTLALAGGVTTLQILPGSANLFGGRGVTVKNLPARTVQNMKFPGAPYGLKMACGENPIRVYGVTKLVAPASRMANVAGYREAWAKAAEYIRKWDDYKKKVDKKDETAEPPERNFQLETLAEVLHGNILVHNHCYRGEEMAVMLDVAKEFGYRITAFHHAVEGYKIADILAANDVCAAVWPDWWGFKHEAFDMVEENAALLEHAGACAIIHSDSAITGQHLNQEAAKAMASGNRAGLGITRAVATRWITYNAARALGIAERTGSLEPGKMADIVLWDSDPFSVYTKVEKVFIDGALVFDRLDPGRRPVTDFDLGIIDPAGERL